MSDIPRSPTSTEIGEHLQSYFSFERLVLFAALHVAITLACVALAFIGHAPVIAVLLWLGGTIVLIAAIALAPSRHTNNSHNL